MHFDFKCFIMISILYAVFFINDSNIKFINDATAIGRILFYRISPNSYKIPNIHIAKFVYIVEFSLYHIFLSNSLYVEFFLCRILFMSNSFSAEFFLCRILVQCRIVLISKIFYIKFLVKYSISNIVIILHCL